MLHVISLTFGHAPVIVTHPIAYGANGCRLVYSVLAHHWYLPRWCSGAR